MVEELEGTYVMVTVVTNAELETIGIVSMPLEDDCAGTELLDTGPARLLLSDKGGITPVLSLWDDE